MNIFSAPIKARSSRGFSLVEVAFALAVISFTCTCLLGLLPLCVTTFHQAMGNTSEADIVQSISNDLQLENFSILTKVYNTPASAPTYYYDHEGSLLPSQTGYFYKATVSLVQVDKTNSPTALNPTGTTSMAAYEIVVTITNIADQSTYTLQHPHKYSFIIANNGL